MPKAEYVTWHGRHFEGEGIKPDVPVLWSIEAFAAGRDNQLQAALEQFLAGKRAVADNALINIYE